jgi:hypothetical protein
MTTPLLPDGTCAIREACRRDVLAVTPECPQAGKCGSCVMWSPRRESPALRNLGICLLENDARAELDCNAPACPYYRPRRGSPAAETWRKGPSRPAARGRSRSVGREVPAPSAAALAQAAVEGAGLPERVAELRELVLELQATTHGKVPALLERFRGGSAEIVMPDGKVHALPLERVFLWTAGVKGALDHLLDAVAMSHLGAADRDKVEKDIRGMRGSMTTFNALFRDKEDHFVGQKGD